MPALGNPQSSAHRAYSLIREKIQQGELRSGQLVSEASLARVFEMSRTPVRDAISRLTVEGLLVSMPSRGTVVASLDIKDVVEIYRLREVLEGLACNLAATSINPQDIPIFDTILAEMKEAREEQDLARFAQLDTRFHSQIAHSSGNGRLVTFLDALWATTPLQSYQHSPAISRRRITVSIDEHQKIFDAIRRHRAKRAEEAMRMHAHSALRDLTGYILGLSEGSTEGPDAAAREDADDKL